MKKTLELSAFYCQGVNNKVMDILEKLPDEQLNRDMHAFFKSLLDTFVHMTTADLNWFFRLKPLFPGSALSGSALLESTLDDVRASVKRDGRKIFPLRRAADQLFVDFTQGLTDEDCNRVIAYQGRTGEPQSNNLGHILLHLFTHQTHHRGVISAMLDMQGVDNDYSGLMKYRQEKNRP